MKSLRLLVLCLFSWLAAGSAVAQTGNATITGRITDPSKAIIVGAHIAAINAGTNVRYEGVTNGTGSYVVAGIPPGSYRIEVEKTGFKTVVEPAVTFHTQDTLEINFEMAVGATSESVTVHAEATNESPAVSMTVTREFVEDIPLNGRSFQDLIQLAPGTVSTQNGYYSIDGQRTDSNNYTVDGVSANLGGFQNSPNQSSGGALAGTAPLQSILGTTQSLASIDSLQEFKIQTSGYTAEYGRNPGGQIQFTTRSGTNDIHGSLFEYLRNTAFDANSWYNDYYHQPQAAEHQNDFGATIGGPLVIPKLYDGKDKTFFFFSYEGLRLLLPAFTSGYVPTQAFRQFASPNVRTFLNSAPLPNGPINQDGCTVPDPSTGLPTACDALFTHSYSYPNDLDNYSIRVDENLSERLRAFFRYANTPSSSTTGAGEVQSLTISTQTWTAGLTTNISSSLVDDFRFNYSRDDEEYATTLQPLAGSVPWPSNLLIPAKSESPYARAEEDVYVPGFSFGVGSNYNRGGTQQHQIQIVDSLAWTRGEHSLKFGGDWRRLTPTFIATPYWSTMIVSGLADIQQGIATTVQIQAGAPGTPVFDNLSFYAEDHWRISPRLTIDYGLRWEFNPPPGPSNGYYLVTLTSDNLATAQLSNAVGTQPYKANYHSFAPRVGFAWNAIPSAQHALTVRGGFGIFYDTGQQTIGAAYAGAYPFNATGPTLPNVPLPLSDAALAPPSLNVPLTPPYPYLNEVTSPSLTLPYTEQWNLAIDEALNSRNTLTASYVGNEGKKLLFSGYYQAGTGIPINPDFANGLYYTYNGSSSNYNALQVQDVGRIGNGLDLVASFTWAHALDNTSNNNTGISPIYGNSDNDIRRMLNLALNYQTPAAGSRRWMQALTHGWVLANRFSAQSGYPLNVVQAYVVLPNGQQATYYPDLVPGVPIYLHGSAADVNGLPSPGNWRLNPAAFAAVPTDADGNPIRQGTLGRNYIRNPGFWALNTAVQRSFSIYEQLHLIFRVEAFNILNHPNLADPDTGLTDSTFGQLTYITTIGSGNALYAMGAARSLQFSLKLQW